MTTTPIASGIQPDTKLPKTKIIGQYTAILNQTGTDNPIATVVLNTQNINIIWTRAAAGVYLGENNQIKAYNTTILAATHDEGATVALSTGDGGVQIATLAGGTHTDGLLFNATVEIKIYNYTPEPSV